MRRSSHLLAGLCGLLLATGRPVPAQSGAAWPVYRGNPALTGVAGGTLGPSLKLRWSFNAGDRIASSPVVGGGRVFFGARNGSLYAVDVQAGTAAWSAELEAAIEAPPLLHDGSVYVGAMDGILHAFDASDGSEKWTFQTGERIVGSANIVRAGDRDLVVVGSHDFILYALDARSGKPVWTHEAESFINGAPAVYREQVIVGGCDSKVHVLSAVDGTGYAIEAGSYIAGSAAVSKDHAFVGHYGNQLLSIDLRKRRIAWEFGDAEEGAAFFSAPAVDERYVVAGCRDEYVYCVDRETAVLKWRFKTGGRVDSGPVLCDGKVLFGSEDGVLYLVSLATGREVWRFDVGRPIFTSPAVVDGQVFVGADDGRLYAFAPGEATQ